ncbi:glycosyltransferase family 4 protein [Tumidithrix elongata RA019]|uniref:Glycosyltransferase family 4 protein n=1 Tax=Tumidithrix elongata BACA0141 TaxID=2716417 RepID=A0AAW9PQ24_9CYAN|nr:glycosyltransferase family 4 protein [Tumidithrix elongata RA019]
MRILFISRHFPNDLRTSTYGTYQRMGMLIDAIKEIAQIDILYYVSPEIDISEDTRIFKEQELSQHWNVPIHISLCHLFSHPDYLPKWQRHLQGIFNFAKQLLFFGTSGVEQVRAFEQCLQRKPDIIFAHRLGAIAPALLTSQPLPPIVLDLDDIEHINFLRTLKQLPKQLEPWFYGLQIPALWWGELQAIRRAKVTFVCSEGDRRYLAETWRLRGVEVVPNTVNIPEPQPIVVEPTLLLLASYQYEPNFHAADFLIEKIWPHIYEAMPEAKLIIAGREPQRIRSYNQAPHGVEFTGFVENLDALYQRSRVVCCPILSGGGTRIKMVEAAAYGKPIVATAIGAEGLMMSDGQEFLMQNSPREFAQACLELLKNDFLCERLGKSARESAIKYYDRSRILRNIQQYVLDA